MSVHSPLIHCSQSAHPTWHPLAVRAELVWEIKDPPVLVKTIIRGHSCTRWHRPWRDSHRQGGRRWQGLARSANIKTPGFYHSSSSPPRQLPCPSGPWFLTKECEPKVHPCKSQPLAITKYGSLSFLFVPHTFLMSEDFWRHLYSKLSSLSDPLVISMVKKITVWAVIHQQRHPFPSWCLAGSILVGESVSFPPRASGNSITSCGSFFAFATRILSKLRTEL